MKRVVSLFVAVLTLSSASAVSAQDNGTFDPFVFDDHSAPGSISIVDDPTGTAPTLKVYSFEIPSATCSDVPYEAGSKERPSIASVWCMVEPAPEEQPLGSRAITALGQLGSPDRCSAAISA